MSKEQSLRNEIDIILSINNTKLNKTILILSSGGSKGICHIGAIKALEEHDIMKNIDTIVGCSAGSLIGALIAVGFTSDEIKNVLMQLDISKLFSFNILNLLQNYGLDDGKNITMIMKKMFENKGFSLDTTFRDIYLRTNIKLIITCVCLNTNKEEYMSIDTYPDLSVITAVRMSTAIPILCAPVVFNNKLYVDGACITCYPIHLFNENEINNVIGVHLSEEISDTEITNMEDYVVKIMKIIMNSFHMTACKGYEKNTIIIKTSDFDIDKNSIMKNNNNDNAKIKLYDIGYNSTKKFLSITL